MPTTLLFVHGTGVRNASYVASLDKVRAQVARFQIPMKVEEFLWGDVLGIDFEGLCLPDPPVRTPEDETDAEHWDYLQHDPLFDLRLWSIPGTAPEHNPLGDDVPTDKLTWQRVEAYTPSLELTAILKQHGLAALFQPAWDAIMLSGLPEIAFAQSGDELPAVSQAFADAVVAQMTQDALRVENSPVVTLPLVVRRKIRDRLLYDWQQKKKGIKDRVQGYLGGATKRFLRPLRARMNSAVAPAVGDILHYHTIGAELRELLHKRIDQIPGDILLVSHSLGATACFELLADPKHRPSSIKGIVTAGSQVALLYEFDALQTLRKGKQPVDFPAWLNIYDENDVLSYRASRLFPNAIDRQVDSVLQPFEAHSAYWDLDETWESIRDFARKLP